MSWLRIFVLALLVAPAAPTVPALAAPLMPSQAPTMQDVDPVDHTGRDADLPAGLRKQSVSYRTEQPPGTIIVNTADPLSLSLDHGQRHSNALRRRRRPRRLPVGRRSRKLRSSANGRTGCRRRR